MGMTTPTGYAVYLLGQLAINCIVFIALCDICKRYFRLDELLSFCAGAFLLGALGYLAFWIAYANYAVFGVVKVVLLAGVVIYFASVAYRHTLRVYGWLAEPVLVASFFFLIAMCFGLSDGGLLNPPEAAAERFSHALPSDNRIPFFLSQALHAGKIPSPLFGDWLASDRPPLQTGLYLLLTLQNSNGGYQAVASWLQATYLLGVWALLTAMALPTAARRMVLLACCLLPTALVNTFYAWPKMLATAYLLLTFTLLFCRPVQNDAERVPAGILIGGLAALAFLGHGTSAFALIGFAVTVIVFWAWPSLKAMVAGGVTLVSLCLPWTLYQNIIDPPGNRLMKWHLAGVEAVDKRGFLTTLRESYGGLSWSEFADAKRQNLQIPVRGWPEHLADLARLMAGDTSGLDRIRTADFFSFLPSLHFVALALIVALVALPFMQPEWRTQQKVAFRMIGALAATLVAFALLIFLGGQAVNHQGTYLTQVLATVFAFTVLTLRMPLIAGVLLALQAISVAAVYIVTIPHSLTQLPQLLLAILAVCALYAYTLAPVAAGLRRMPSSSG